MCAHQGPGRHALMGALAALALLAPAVTGRAAADPAMNTPPDPNFNAGCVERGGLVVAGYCAYDAAGGGWTLATPAREAAALEALGAARIREGLPPLRLPTNWSTLTPDEQQFVLTNLARVDRGLPPLVAMADDLSAVAAQGALANADPAPAGPPWSRYAFAANWAGDAQPAVALYGYLYLDGWGGSAATTPNVDCTGPEAPGCWGHRHNVLGDYGQTGLMGVASVAGGPAGTGSSAQTYSAYSGPPVSVGYTWVDALLNGAAGGTSAAPAINALWPFADLLSDPWAAGAAATLAHAGVVAGTGSGTFSPEAPVTLQEMVTFLGRALAWPATAWGPPPGTAPWAAAAMGAAGERGLLPPGLAPTVALTRLDTANMVLRALALPAAAAPMPFSDIASLGPSDVATLTTAVADGLLQGEGNGVLDPGGGLTRAQAVVLLQRAILLQARAGQLTTLGTDPVSAVAATGGQQRYEIGSLRLLAPAPTADPTAYWQAGGPSGEDALVSANGAWWVGRGAWTPQVPPAWAAGATAYGQASLRLWPAGSQGVGPALFAPTVQVIAYPSGLQELLPAAPRWQGAPDQATTDPVRAAVDALAG